MTEQLLTIQNVSKVFSSGFFNRQRLIAVDEVSLEMPLGQPSTVTIAGESGSGKTTLAQMILGFIAPSSGDIRFHGKNIQKMNASSLLTYRHQVQAVFQNPYDTFNPFYRVDHVFDMAIKRFHLAKTRNEAKRIVIEALEAVRLAPEETIGRYPHQLSGGQLQRVMIARALLLKPQIIVADEPVSMIDVSLRAIILDIMINLKKEFGISLLYITHDLSTALQISDKILIMYKGTIVERGDAASVIQNPKHPYTRLLVQSIPIPDPAQKWSSSLELTSRLDDRSSLVNGCKFYDRCPAAFELCKDQRPPAFEVEPGHKITCFLYRDKPS
jgi:oligopeptide/dipeptide ABC transporter ATP-binding protein